VDEEKVSLIPVIIGGPEESFETEIFQSEFMRIFHEMIEIDKNPGEEKRGGRGQRPGKQINQRGTREGDGRVMVEFDDRPPVRE
jgi:hypothetical protein